MAHWTWFNVKDWVRFNVKDWVRFNVPFPTVPFLLILPYYSPYTLWQDTSILVEIYTIYTYINMLLIPICDWAVWSVWLDGWPLSRPITVSLLIGISAKSPLFSPPSPLSMLNTLRNIDEPSDELSSIKSYSLWYNRSVWGESLISINSLWKSFKKRRKLFGILGNFPSIW